MTEIAYTYLLCNIKLALKFYNPLVLKKLIAYIRNRIVEEKLLITVLPQPSTFTWQTRSSKKKGERIIRWWGIEEEQIDKLHILEE